MSLSIKSLQARSRATHASYLPSAIDYCAPSFLLSVHTNPKAHLVIPSRAPMGQAVRIDRPMSALASDLFALGVSASQAFASYDRIECAPSVGVNLLARA